MIVRKISGEVPGGHPANCHAENSLSRRVYQAPVALPNESLVRGIIGVQPPFYDSFSGFRVRNLAIQEVDYMS